MIGQKKPAEAAEHADDAADDADVFREVVRNVLVDGSLADPHDDPEHEDERREHPDVRLEVDVRDAPRDELLALHRVAGLDFNGGLLPELEVAAGSTRPDRSSALMLVASWLAR